MAVGFRYSAMTVTGALHLTLGIICVIISIVGLSVDTYTYEKSYSFDEVKYVIYEFPSKGTATGSFIASLGVSIDVDCGRCILIKNLLIHQHFSILDINGKNSLRD